MKERKRNLKICSAGDTHYANRHDWSWTNGREHGAAASQRRPSMRGLRHVTESGDGVDRKEGRWLLLAGRPRKEAHEAAGGLVNGSRGGRGQNYRGSPAPPRGRGHSDRRWQFLLH